MIDEEVIEELCRKYTLLSSEDVQRIIEVSRTMQMHADLSKANVFIDCKLANENHAIVVAEAAPRTAPSVYDKRVVGNFAYQAFEPAVMYCLDTGNDMTSNRAITQEQKKVEQSVVPIWNGDRVIGALIMEKDISERDGVWEELEALSKTTEKLSGLLLGDEENQPIVPELMEESLFFVNMEGTITYSNPSAINLVHELTGQHCEYGESLPDYLPELEHFVRSEEELLVKELEFRGKIFRVKKIRLPRHQKYNGMFLILRDLTDLREKEKELVMQSVAIQEIHHRVKNNLQTVASLLRLQMRRGVPEESKIHFVESLNRILSIASVYEVILSNSSIDEVDIFELIRRIGDMLVYTSGDKVKIDYEGEGLSVESGRAVSVALIINELIQNCLNYAFEGRPYGKITVSFTRNEGEMEVVVRDNGIGYKESDKPSLGLHIVKRMAEDDLAGRFIISGSAEGTTASIAFPEGGRC